MHEQHIESIRYEIDEKGACKGYDLNKELEEEKCHKEDIIKI